MGKKQESQPKVKRVLCVNDLTGMPTNKFQATIEKIISGKARIIKWNQGLTA